MVTRHINIVKSIERTLAGLAAEGNDPDAMQAHTALLASAVAGPAGRELSVQHAAAVLCTTPELVAAARSEAEAVGGAAQLRLALPQPLQQHCLQIMEAALS